MKLVKMSLLAATLIASSAFAIDNVKVSGDAKLFYATFDSADGTLFNTVDSAGQTSLGLGITADLTEGVSAGTHVTAVSAMGLTNIVGGVWESGLNDTYMVDEAWLAATVGKTTAKAGRMTLDTPLAFTETWSVAYNTFEAAVLMNTDIPDTTLVGAYIGGANNGNFGGQWNTNNLGGVTADTNATQNTNFGLVNGGNGAYAIGAINNSWAPLTAQGWYYNLPETAYAYWLQADLALDMGLTAGLQFTGIEHKNQVPTADTGNTAVAGKVGYEMKDTFALSVAASQTGENNQFIGAGANFFGAQTKLYTEAWWNFTYVERPDTTSINVTATTPEELTYVALGLYATQATVGENGTGADLKQDMMEITLEAAKSFGPLDVGLYYILTDAEDQNQDVNGEGQSYNSVQAYLTYNF